MPLTGRNIYVWLKGNSLKKEAVTRIGCQRYFFELAQVTTKGKSVDKVHNTMSFEGIVGKIDDHYEMLQFDWKIKNFFSLVKTVDSRWHSPAFDHWGDSFHLEIYPNGEKRNKTEGWISLYLILEDRRPPLEVEFEFGIITASGEIEYSAFGKEKFASQDRGWGESHLLHRQVLNSRKHDLAPSGVFTVAVTLKTGTYLTEISTKDVNVQTDFDYFTNSHSKEERQQVKRVTFKDSVQAHFENSACEERMDEQSEKAGPEKVLQDLMKVWRSGDNSDVTIYVKDAEFQAHKVILGARSPVLLAMFQHDTTESRSGEIKISDCEPDVFKEFLSYIYSGAPQELTSLNAVALYAVAEKYLADDLKDKCLKYVRSNLNVDTFCDTILLALNYGERELLQQANDFASENIRQIVKSVEWQRFIQNAPTTANEILIKALGS